MNSFTVSINIINKSFRWILSFFVIISLFFGTNGTLRALEECTEEKLRDLGVSFVNCLDETREVCELTPSGTSGANSSIEANSNVYFIGDSIMNANKSSFENKVEDAGFNVTAINADGGRAITYDSVGGQPPGLQSVVDDSAIISGSDVVVIQLGTNSGREDLGVQIPAMISAVRATGFTGKIFWVNLFYTANGGPVERNNVISAQATLQNYTIIDTTNAGIPLKEDGIHPTVEGDVVFANTIANGLLSRVGNAPLASTVYDPISLFYPNFPDESAVASAITSYITDNKSSSPWLGVGGDIGSWLVSESKTRNINPLLIASIGKQENGFGTTDQNHVVNYYNYFGMKGSGPVDIPGSAYRGFESPIAGITFFLDKVQENINGPDKGYYTEVQNFYDYIGMHQAGIIKYPGEPLGNQGPTGQDGYDSAMRVYVSWTTTNHPNNRYDGQLFNPGIYYTNSINFINRLLGTNLSDIPTKGPTSPSTGTNCGQDGAVSTSGYAFPLAPQTKISYSSLPCNKETCHHDDTPAADLSYADVAGKSVYAIIGGKIDDIGEQEPGFCQSIQLEGSDGFYYWYGHVIDVTVSVGDQVQAGQEIAKVADWTPEHTCNGTSSGDHLHIDRGCVINGVGQRGGNDDCRDPAFIPLLNELYESLPN